MNNQQETNPHPRPVLAGDTAYSSKATTGRMTVKRVPAMPLSRREFLIESAAVLTLPLLANCKPEDHRHVASVDMASLAQAVDTQHCEEWCWAASISMIFAFHGHPIAQERIVADTYGAVVCLPAGVTATIGSDLSRYYTDDNGVAFRSIVSAAYDPANGIRTLSNAMIVAELLNNRPLLYCNRQHAEVLYSVTYDGSADAPNIVEADVIDPWPFNPRLHALSPSELAPVDYGGDMTFLAAVTVL